MLLDVRLEGVVEVRELYHRAGRAYYEANLISDDGQTLYLYEGQLKEVDGELEIGAHYRVVFRPFVNNRWIELKIFSLERVEAPG